VRTMPRPAELRTRLAVFAKATGLDLASWQVHSLALRKRMTVIVGPRQSGKSRGIAAKGLQWAFARPDQHVLAISAGEDASRRLLRVCADAADNPLLGPSVLDEMAAELTLTNGSTIVSVPSSEAQIRGRSIDLLLVDEAEQVDPELLLSAALPTTAARPAARIVLAGSPGSPVGPFYEFACAGEQGDDHVETFRWQLEDATWIQPTVIAAARAQLPAAAFAREYEGRFADTEAQERVIAREWIDAARARTLEPEGERVLGCDVARRGRDFSVVVEMRGPVARVVHSTLGADTMALAAKLAQLSREGPGPAPTLAVDEIGVGGPVIDRLVQLDVPVAGFNASHRAPDQRRHLNMRASVWWELRELFRLGQIDIPAEDRQLADELAAVTYRLDAAGRIVIADKAKMAKSPDRADALTIATWASSERQRSEQITAMIEDTRRDAEREPHVPTELEWAGGPTAEELLGGRRRRSWKDNLDPDLPTFYG
jgi:Terminase large subunit, T4likevirus-type, N-terminal